MCLHSGAVSGITFLAEVPGERKKMLAVWRSAAAIAVPPPQMTPSVLTNMPVVKVITSALSGFASIAMGVRRHELVRSSLLTSTAIPATLHCKLLEPRSL